MPRSTRHHRCRHRPSGSSARVAPARPGLVAAAVVVAAIVVAVPRPAEAQAAGDDAFDPVREHIRRVMAERSLPSVAVAAAKDGAIAWEEAFGWADRAERRRATPHTLYSLASISKPMTATGLVVLAGEGAVDLDAPTNDYLGAGGIRGLAGDPSDATLRRVLSHTAGLPLHYQFFYEGEGFDPPTPEETIARYGILALPPGHDFEYSNLGYGILDHVIGRVSGRPYGDFMRVEVFLPLGMTRTSVGLTPELAPYAATRYGVDGAPLPYYRFDHPGASAVWASAHDLVRFGLFHLGHVTEGARPVLGEEARRGMREAVPLEDGSSSGYGLGWFIGEEYGFRKVWHTGSMPGVSTMLALYPEEGVVVAVLLNALDREQRVEIAREVAAVLIDGYAAARERAEEAARSRADEEGEEREEEPSFRPPPELVGTWSGTLRTWKVELPMEVDVGEDGDVHVRVRGELEAVLNDPSFEEGRLRGRYAGEIPTPDALRHPRQSVGLDLLLRGDRLFGQITARTSARPAHFALTSYAELRRQ